MINLVQSAAVCGPVSEPKPKKKSCHDRDSNLGPEPGPGFTAQAMTPLSLEDIVYRASDDTIEPRRHCAESALYVDSYLKAHVPCCEENSPNGRLQE